MLASGLAWSARSVVGGGVRLNPGQGPRMASLHCSFPSPVTAAFVPPSGFCLVRWRALSLLLALGPPVLDSQDAGHFGGSCLAQESSWFTFRPATNLPQTSHRPATNLPQTSHRLSKDQPHTSQRPAKATASQQLQRSRTRERAASERAFHRTGR